MIITYLGKQFFKIQQGDTVLAFNPIGKGSKAGTVSRFGADIALSTTNHPDYNGVENLSHGDTQPFVVSGPGDYEIKGVFVRGFLSESIIDGKKFINTIYSVLFEGMNMCFLGALSEEKLSSEVREAIGNPDILFVPISDASQQAGEGVLTPAAAYKLAVSLEPKIIIPMEYLSADSVKSTSPVLKVFLKEAGEETVQPLEKLTLKKKDLEGKDGEVVVLGA
ncbi:MAG: MBL fold metallo-hydrolase [Candidatus Pacebacteria bacterium]|jgi:L-ascorbate metabolism protein UlaG (beta-lactamase superfamily)|nr:MBL fold metallo-hydrolase [Candidatus Paceibacterota bacterium]